MNQETIEKIFLDCGFNHFKWTSGDKIKVAQWVRVKCMYGCSSYGVKSACPPNVPTVLECRKFASEYQQVAVFHFEKLPEENETNSNWEKQINKSLINLEKEIFLQGYYKTFALLVGECCLCKECITERISCRQKDMARPCSEAFAIDVYATVSEMGFPIKVLKEKNEKMNRYGFLFIE